MGKYVVFLFLLLAVVIYSCRKDSSSSVNTQADTALSDAQLIAEAKTYFESSRLNSDSVKLRAVNSAATPRQRSSKRIDWNKAYIGPLHTGKIVMAPLSYDSTLTVTYRGNTWKLNKIARAFIFKDKTGTMRTQVVIRIPESYSMEQAPASSFSGLVLVEDWGGNGIKTIRFKNGKTSRMSTPVLVSDKKALAYRTATVTCEGFSWGHCAWNGNTGEFYGCWEDGFEEVCPSNPGGVNPYEQEDEDYGGGGSNDNSGSGGPNTTSPPTPPPVITNKVKDSCLNRMVAAAIGRNIQYNLTQSMNSIFNSNTAFNLEFVDGSLASSIDGTTSVISQTGSYSTVQQRYTELYSMNVRITLNSNTLPNASEEYITATILHEALHAYFRATNTSFDHHVMITQYIPWYESIMSSMYPNMSTPDLRGLAYGGLMNEAAFATSTEYAMRNAYGVINDSYKEARSGTACH